jgi:tetratricopeptide (TPR) repeat protein/transcriptional regulator with XRE-family HTH domain
MTEEPLPDLSIVFTFLRDGQGVSKADLARLAGTSAKLIHDYERGRKPLKRERLEYLVSFLGLSPEEIDETLARLAANRGAARPPLGGVDPMPEWRRRSEAAAVRAGRMAADFVRSFLSMLTQEGEALLARQEAEFLWSRLKRRKPAERRMLVENSRKFRKWALCERVAAESIEVAGDDPHQCLELAELAVFIAERVPGEAAWRWRNEGYAGIHLTNARRVCGDLRDIDRDLARAEKAWEDGAPGDPGLLSPAIFLGLVANLRRAQRRFPEALERLAEAMAADRGDLRARLLYTQAGILVGLGDLESSTAVLREALPLIDEQREPRLAVGVRFLFLVLLCLQGKAAEAKRGLDAVRIVAERQGKELDRFRVVWLQGTIAAGLGRREEARKALGQVRRELGSLKIAFDYALVSLELALVLLEEGRTPEVRRLAEEMYWIFTDQNVPENALAALRVFCEAAQKEAATAELAQRVVRYLYRAQHDPELPFEEEGAEAR